MPLPLTQGETLKPHRSDLTIKPTIKSQTLLTSYTDSPHTHNTSHRTHNIYDTYNKLTTKQFTHTLNTQTHILLCPIISHNSTIQTQQNHIHNKNKHTYYSHYTSYIQLTIMPTMPSHTINQYSIHKKKHLTLTIQTHQHHLY
jgi:hypothetical protein